MSSRYMWQRLLRWGGSGQLIQVRIGVSYHPQSSPPASTRKKSLIVPLAIFFSRNGNQKEILSKIFISAKKERPGKGWQRAKLTVDYWPEPRTHFWVQPQKAQNRGWSTATT